MPFDIDNADNGPTDLEQVANQIFDPTDLELITQLIRLAALNLTPTPGTEFTFEQLMEEIHVFPRGSEVGWVDVRIVLNTSRLLEKRGDKFVLP